MYDRAVREINATESRARAAAPLRTELAAVLGCGPTNSSQGNDMPLEPSVTNIADLNPAWPAPADPKSTATTISAN
jgi:hypothetical protein